MRLSQPLALALAGTAAMKPANALYYDGRRVLTPYGRVPNQVYSRSRTDPLALALDFLRTPFYGNDVNFFRMTEAAMDRLAGSSITTPRYSVSEKKNSGSLELTMELPGVSAKDLTVELEDDRFLRIQGSRTFSEGITSEFDRSFQLDEEIDPSSLKVTLSSGILKLTGTKKQKLVKRLAIDESPENEEVVNFYVSSSVKKNEVAGEVNPPERNTQDSDDGLMITEEDA
ncbi:hypothetical protein ACA910_009156 [Epithemia clementina (nom. ined.)]